MRRLIAFCLGGLMTAGLLAVFVPPDPSGSEQLVAAETDTMVSLVPETTVQPGVEARTEEQTPPVVPATAESASADGSALVADESVPAPDTGRETGSVAKPPMPPLAPPQNLEMLHWEPIWAPFRYRLSAEGFARRITDQSGIETLVLKEAPGSFQVMIARRESVDRVVQLQQIQEVTGLNLVKDIER